MDIPTFIGQDHPNGAVHAPVDSYANDKKFLEQQLSEGYKPSTPLAGMIGFDGLPINWMRQDVENMLAHPAVRQALNYFKGGIAGAQFWGGENPDDDNDEQGLPISDDPRVARFVKEQCERFWDRGVPLLQSGYEYGWVGMENIYDDVAGYLKWDRLVNFNPRDTFLLTQDFKPIGVRVKNVQSQMRPLDLWLAGDEVPAKGLWYPHQPRYHMYYGLSQLVGAWRPWRRLAWKDGAESVLDMACYRFGVGWVVARYPDEDLQGPSPGAPNTTLDSEGNPRRFMRDIMRQIAEQAKAGAVVGLPSKRDEQGEYTCDIQWPQGTLQGIENLINYNEHLQKQITEGVGVPPELLEASETGSGYSGRRIPLESFLSNQQQIADSILKLFVDQVLMQLVRWNFGRDVRFNVKVKSLIKTRTKDQQVNAQPAAQNPPSTLPPAQHQAPAIIPVAQSVHNPQEDLRSRQAMLSITDKMREIARKALAG